MGCLAVTRLHQPPQLGCKCCLAKETMVRMADGSSLPIERVQVGDMVCTSDQGMAQVRQVLRGMPTELLCCIRCEDDEITATGSHPFLTVAGWKTAAQLGSSDSLLMADGLSRRIVGVQRVEYEYAVFNLELADRVAGIICNGFVVGDFRRQSALLPD